MTRYKKWVGQLFVKNIMKILENVCFQGSKNIEGMMLNWTQVVPIQLHAEAFKKMNQLSFLEVGPNMVELS